ncbi:MAG: type IV secretory system conjugative DNA transfer family protein [Acidimicrobiia bacterium]
MPFTLYLDEFQSFTTSALDTMVSEGRKFGLELVLANQFFSQLRAPIREAIFGNVGTKMIFRVGARDAALLEEHVRPEFDAQDLLYLPKYAACCSMLADGMSLRPYTLTTRPPLAPLPGDRRSLLQHLLRPEGDTSDLDEADDIIGFLRNLDQRQQDEPATSLPAHGDDVGADPGPDAGDVVEDSA